MNSKKPMLMTAAIVIWMAAVIGCSSSEGTGSAGNTVTRNSGNSAAVMSAGSRMLDAKVLKAAGVHQLRISSDIQFSKPGTNGEMAGGDGYVALYVNGTKREPLLSNNAVLLEGLQEGNNTVRLIYTTNEHQETDLVKELTVEVPRAADIVVDKETLNNTSGKVMITSVTLNKAPDAGHTSLGIVSKSGTIIVSDPNNMPATKGLIKADAVTTSHTHGDHVDTKFMQRTREAGWATISSMKEESFTVKDIAVTGIAGGHNSDFDPANPDAVPENSNYIYLYEVDGVRIANFADYGQDELTEAQLEQLGRVDIALLPMSDNPRPGFTIDKSLRLIEQTKPKIISPIHYTQTAIDAILTELNITDRSEVDVLNIDAEDIAAIKGTKYIFLN